MEDLILSSRIKKYQTIRYENILKEINMISDIIGSCSEKDLETKNKYLKKINELKQEMKKISEEVKKEETNKAYEEDSEERW